jgi:hypothetical protein
MTQNNPELFIADVEVSVTLSTKHKTTLCMEKIPILLLDGKIPTKAQEQKLFKKFYSKFHIKEKFDKIKFSNVRIYNVKFSSKIQYDFKFD